MIKKKPKAEKRNRMCGQSMFSFLRHLFLESMRKKRSPQTQPSLFLILAILITSSRFPTCLVHGAFNPLFCLRLLLCWCYFYFTGARESPNVDLSCLKKSFDYRSGQAQQKKRPLVSASRLSSSTRRNILVFET